MAQMLGWLPLKPLACRFCCILEDSNGTWRNKQFLGILAPTPNIFEQIPSKFEQNEIYNKKQKKFCTAQNWRLCQNDVRNNLLKFWNFLEYPEQQKTFMDATWLTAFQANVYCRQFSVCFWKPTLKTLMQSTFWTPQLL